eukprot:PhM_4_TR17591/c0_g1_i1/m.83122/K13126/PABPC; polyadenylate-binding protein
MSAPATAAPTAAAAAAPAGPAGPIRPSSSLYVGDLNPEVTEQMLYEHFKVIGPIPSIRVLRDSSTGVSLGYAYVNFASQGEAEKALNELNYSRIRDRPCRIMYVNRDPTLRKSGVGNIIIRNLAKEIDYRGVTELCTKFGPILSCRIMYDATGVSKGCAFVHFADQESANAAVDSLDNKTVVPESSEEDNSEVRPLKVEHYQPQQVLQQRALDTFTNLYIKHIKPEVTDEQLKALFDTFGPTLSVRIMRGDGDVSKGFAFCSYKEHEPAVKAVDTLHDKEHEYVQEGKTMYVQRAMKRSERQKHVRQALRERRLQYAQYTNLYIKNLDDVVTSEKLQSVFAAYGEIRSAKVMKDAVTGLSKGFGFVSFVNAEDAKRAVKELANRLILSSKPLFVTYAQTKDERRRQLEERQQRARYTQMEGGFPGMGGPGQHYAPPQMPQPMYPFGTPGVFPGGPGMARPQQMMGNPMMGGQPRPQMMPQRGGPPGMMRPGMPGTIPQMPMPGMMKQPAMPRPAMPGAPVAPGATPARPQAKSASGIDPSMLAQMQPEQARNVLGEKLYHRISKMYPDQAAKITGMLLEMDNSEILNLLDS